MTPFFLLTMPRSGGTALARMLDATPGIRCAGESHELLPRLRALEDYPAAEHAGGSWGRQDGARRPRAPRPRRYHLEHHSEIASAAGARSEHSIALHAWQPT